ncbi:Hemicentin-1 [Anabarilius grahami]|uniref:Hemicentin-1 n=1 Tax=Anabarilius grahami TaxID=495550 RepID=A0A3N0YYM4_ANAGA|nr:Hemicentin-1 [Anabarilius grahami]
MKKQSFFLPKSCRILCLRLFGFGFLYFSLVTAGTHAAECPLQLSPQRVVVEYGGSVSVNCNTSVPHDGMGWEANEGAVSMRRDNLITWRVSELREWDIKPFCYMNYNASYQCQLELQVTVYKTPDSVSISTVTHNGPMMEGNQYELQCDVLNVAPVQYLTVKWYKGQTLVDQTTFTDTIKTPVNETATLMIRPNRSDDGVQYRCEAELELGEEGPQPPPKVTSDPLSITVHYKPIINETKLPSLVSVSRGYPVVIVCEAEGNPKPTISWNISTNNPVYSETLTITDSTPEDLSCIASNSVGSTIRHVKVSVQDISTRVGDHNGPMIEGQQYKLQCDVHIVAKSVVVRWYKGQTLVNQTNFNDTIKTPVNETATLMIRPDRSDDGVQYRCEAELELGEEGPQPPPKVTSDPLSITVHYKPIINETKLPSLVSVFRGYPVVIVCEAEGNPEPTISWNISTNNPVYSETLTITDSTPEDLSCIASNSVGSTIRHVKVSVQDISIRVGDHNGPMIEGQQYKLQCDVHIVAKSVVVRWYKGQTLVNQTTFNDTIKTPVNKTATLMIRPDRSDDGVQYRCEAELELGEEGPRPPPKVTTDPLNITVHYKPIINETKPLSKVPVFRGYEMVLVCEAEGNPKPTISWNLGTNNLVYSETLNITDSTPEDLSCIANNYVGTDIRHVKVVLKGTHAAECPVQLNPQRAVVRYGGSVSVSCSTSVPHEGMGWEASEGAVSMNSSVNLITWRVSELTEWDIKPFCYLNPKNGDQCLSNLPVTVYNIRVCKSSSTETPDSVSISTVNPIGPMKEGNQYELQCDVLNVAPVQYLTVKWYKGQTLVNQTNFTDTTITPVNETVTLMIRPDRSDDGVQYRCEAELELGEEGPRPPPKVTSKPLSVEVHYKPKHSNSTETINISDEVTLNCTVKANPAPTYTWDSEHLKEKITSPVLPSSTLSPGNYTCIATNSQGRDIKVFVVRSTGQF